MTPEPQPTAPPTPALLFDTLNAHQRTEAIKTGIELGVFTEIAQGKTTVAEIAKACDASGNGNTGTWTNGVASTSGKFNWATNYDGVNDYINAGIPATLNNLTNKTLSACRACLTGSRAKPSSLLRAFRRAPGAS